MNLCHGKFLRIYPSITGEKSGECDADYDDDQTWSTDAIRPKPEKGPAAIRPCSFTVADLEKQQKPVATEIGGFIPAPARSLFAIALRFAPTIGLPFSAEAVSLINQRSPAPSADAPFQPGSHQFG